MVVLRVSDLVAFSRCSRGWQWAKIFNPQVEGKDRTNVVVPEAENHHKGTLLHKLYELHLTEGLDLTDTEGEVLRVCWEEASSMFEDLSEDQLRASPSWDTAITEVSRSVYGFPEWASSESLYAFRENIQTEVELVLDHPSLSLAGHPVRIVGHIDVLSETDTVIGNSWIVDDYKSSAGTPATLKANNQQLLSYATLATLSGQPVGMVRHIHTKINGRTRRAKPPFFTMTHHYVNPETFVKPTMLWWSTVLERMEAPFTKTWGDHSVTEMCQRLCRFNSLCSRWSTDPEQALTLMKDTYLDPTD